MSFDLVTIPCLSDNYAFLLRDQTSGKVALIDVPEAAPIAAKLDELGWTLTEIWLTHHHPDHIQGVPALIADHPARVIGAKADAERLPPLDAAYDDGQSFTFGAHTVDVIDVSGHTRLYRRQPDGAWLWSFVRRHARADVGQPAKADAPARRYHRMFGSRIHAVERKIRPDG